MLGYRLFIEVGGDRRQVVKLACEQLHTWMRSKRWNADALEPGRATDLADGVRGQLLELPRQDGSHSLRARFAEDKCDGQWNTQLTVHVPAQDKRKPWLWLDIESPGSRYASTPRLAGMLLEVFDGRDGGSRLGPGPSRVGVHDVGAVVESVCDPERRGLVFVAASDGEIPHSEWAGYLRRLLKDTVGLSSAYVLDAQATLEFNNAIGLAHSVDPWTVRTFRPGVEPDDPVNAKRHRVLGTARISSDSSRNIARMLGQRAREATLETPLPRAAVKIGRAFEQQIDERLVAPLAEPVVLEPSAPQIPVVETAVEVSPAVEFVHPPSVPAELLNVLGVLQRTLGEGGVTVERIRELAQFSLLEQQRRDSQQAITTRLRTYEDRVEKLTVARDELRRQLDDSHLEQQIADLDLVQANTRVRHLQKLLSASGRAAEAWSDPEVDEVAARPDDYEVLLDRLNEFGHVAFTGDRAKVRELDEHDRSGVWAGKIWDVLGVLNDYAAATSAGHAMCDVDGYLRKTPDGYRTYSFQRHARDESEDVRNNPRFNSARVLPVPLDVHPDGVVFMGAHFKIAQMGMISPRLHYFDDTRRTGKVYVGYIGRHLPTKQTN